MADLHRGTRWYDVRLSGREVGGVVAGTLVMLCVTFAIGVNVGHRLAASPTPPKPPDHPETTADAGVPKVDFTYQKTLTEDAPTHPIAPAPKPTPPPKPIVAPEPAPAHAIAPSTADAGTAVAAPTPIPPPDLDARHRKA